MKIKVIFFASLREIFGEESCDLSLTKGATILDIKRKFASTLDGKEVLCAVNQVYSQSDYLLENGDEVAFFPPVTGG